MDAAVVAAVRRGTRAPARPPAAAGTARCSRGRTRPCRTSAAGSGCDVVPCAHPALSRPSGERWRRWPAPQRLHVARQPALARRERDHQRLACLHAQLAERAVERAGPRDDHEDANRPAPCATPRVRSTRKKPAASRAGSPRSSTRRRRSPRREQPVVNPRRATAKPSRGGRRRRRPGEPFHSIRSTGRSAPAAPRQRPSRGVTLPADTSTASPARRRRVIAPSIASTSCSATRPAARPQPTSRTNPGAPSPTPGTPRPRSCRGRPMLTRERAHGVSVHGRR